MGQGSARPFVLNRQYEALYGSAEHRRQIRGIVTAFPDQRLDPLEVARWPWHLTAFYLEWLTELAQAQDEADEAEQRAEAASVVPDGAVSVEGLIGLGAQVREAT